MKYRTAALAFGIAAALPLSACSSAEGGHSRAADAPAALKFLPDAKDSDYASGINCAQEGNSEMGLGLSTLNTWLGKKVVTVTLGDADNLYGANTDPYGTDPRIHFLGGATIRYAGDHRYDIVTSDDPTVKEIDLGTTDFSAEVPIPGEDFSVKIELNSGKGDTFDISCIHPVAVPTSPQLRV